MNLLFHLNMNLLERFEGYGTRGAHWVEEGFMFKFMCKFK